MNKFDYDDKDLVIVAVLILGIMAMIVLSGTDAAGVVNSIITGLFGVAVGKGIK